MHQGKKPQHKLIRPYRSRPEQSEPLEPRRLLSAAACAAAQPDLALNTAAEVNLVQPAATLTSLPRYTPAHIRHTFGFDELSGIGNGQTIAIVDAYNDPNIASDLATFDKEFALPAPPNFDVVSQTGASAAGIATNAGWAGETALDVEWVHAAAPGANILLVEASDASLTNLLAAVNYASHEPGVSVVSMSWGSEEFDASGDLPPSTSGLRAVEPRPTYRESVQETGVRTIADVSRAAEENTGFAVYDSVQDDGTSGWQKYGGTSADSPQWGALTNIVDQARTAAALGTLDGATPTPAALFTPYDNPATYAADDHDITAVVRFGCFGEQVFDVGSDLQTTSGPPRAGALVETLSQVPQGAPTDGPALVIEISTTPGGATSGLSTSHSVAPGEVGDIVVVGPPKFTPTPVVPVGPVAQGQGQVSLAFNDTLIRHGSPALSVAAEGHIELAGLGASSHGIASASTAVGQWIGALDTSLVSWLTGTGTASLSVAAITPSFVDDASPIGFGADPDVASITSAASRLATQAAAPLVAGPATILYRFANFDPVGIFADSMADFARESASITPLDVQHDSHRAWIITGIVLGVDAVLATRWYADRNKVRKQAIAANPQSPQAGPLPTGL